MKIDKSLIRSVLDSVLVLILILSPLSVRAADPTFEYLGSTLWTGINDIEAQGYYAYCTMPYGLVVLDFTDPTTPVEVGRLFLEGSCQGLDVSGGLACVATTNAGLHVVDISNPALPTRLSTRECPDAGGVNIQGNLAYCYGVRGLWAVDISDPAVPLLVFETAEYIDFWDMHVESEVAFLSFNTSWESGLMALDLSVPGVITEISRLPVALIRHMAVSKGKAYAVSIWHEYGFVVIDVSDPTAMQVDTSLLVPGLYPLPRDVALTGHHALVADARNGLVTFDITNPEAPVLAGIYEPAGAFAPEVVVAIAGYVLLNATYAQFQILSAVDPAAPVELGRYDYPYRPSSLAVVGDQAWVGDERGVLYEVDISDPGQPTYGEYRDLSARYRVNDVTVAGDYAYVAQDGGLAICDLTDPGVLPRFELDNCYNFAVAVRDTLLVSYAYGPLYCGFGVVPRLFNVANPMAPAPLGHVEMPLGCSAGGGGLAFAGDYLYVAEWGSGPSDEACGGLHLVDISVPYGAEYVSTVEPSGWAPDVAVQGDLAYALIPPGLTVMDITAPSAPTILGSCSAGGWRLEAAGQVAYVVTYRDSVAVIDISRPDRPEPIGSYATSGEPKDVAADGDLVYIIDDCGLVVLRATLPVGACCLPDGSCVAADQATCETTLGGDYNGLTGECRGDINGNGVDDGCEPTGACCLADYQCVTVTQIECEDLLGGTYSGDDTECSGDHNGNDLDDLCEPTGACCLEDGTCVVGNQTDCEWEHRLGGVGVYAGDDTECWGDLDENGTDDICEPHGACCPPAGGCLTATQAYCQGTLGGIYAGDESSCLGDTNSDGIDDACLSPYCCVGRVGDANGNGQDEPTIGDISVMIDARFISATCDGIVPCVAEADINQSGGPDPDCYDITIGDIAILIDYLFITGPSVGLPDCL